jgi:uncharacterized OsmC-like protein
MIATKTKADAGRINGIDVAAVRALVDAVERDPANAMTRWGVTTRWAGGTASETSVEACEIGGKRVAKDFHLRVDEPLELAGANQHPNPQEYLLTAFNACMMVGYVAQASLRGIELDGVEIESSGDIDLRGFLGLSGEVKPGYDHVHYTVRIRGDGTPEQFDEIHRAVMATSPNRFNMASPIRLTSDLVVA